MGDLSLRHNIVCPSDLIFFGPSSPRCRELSGGLSETVSPGGVSGGSIVVSPGGELMGMMITEPDIDVRVLVY
jgi:hypothetical protein